jgi:restriction system protein
MILERIKEWAAGQGTAPQTPPPTSATPRQGMLFTVTPFSDETPTIRSDTEMESAFDHLEYAVFRRFENQLTRAERARLDNTIRNTLFKLDRYRDRCAEATRGHASRRCQAIREKVESERERVERLRMLAKRADLKLAQLTTLTAEGFEEFVAELLESLGYEVDRVGGTDDQGADLKARRGGQLAVVQCKYHKKGVVGSPELQKFLGTVHHTKSHKGLFVTTSTFTLSAERFAADHPIELIDGPRLVELVQEVLGPSTRKEEEPSWFA